MLLLGLLLLLAGALVVLAALLTAEVSAGRLEILGIDLSATTFFLLGLGAGVAVLLGAVVARKGAGRTLRKRRERDQLTELSEKLERVEAERRRDHDDEGPRI
ncbi:hypothetical protein [Nocardioides nanhaiensis]|uniref:LapA family protein n=1 Tax=Nocardioides nanhaiensis TaxID=1476871 RepID=A0ABP8VVL3_9ACTN